MLVCAQSVNGSLLVKMFSEIYSLFSIIPAIALLLVHRPFIYGFDKFKFTALCAIGVFYSWTIQNSIFHREQASIGLIRVQEYIVVVSQSVCVAVFTSLISRWISHAKYLRPLSAVKHLLVVNVAIAVMVMMGLIGWVLAFPDTKTFYVGSLLLWSMPILMYLWFVCGSFIVQRIYVFAVCVCLPSIYFCSIDAFVFYSKVGVTAAGLSLERVIFHFISTVIIVVVSFGLDRANAILYTHHDKPLLIGKKFNGWQHILNDLRLIFVAFNTDENRLDPVIIKDFETCLDFVARKLKHIYNLCSAFPQGLH